MPAKLDLKRLGAVDWIMALAFVAIGLVIAYALVSALVPGIPQPLLAAIGAVIGIAAWISYLLKRNT